MVNKLPQDGELILLGVRFDAAVRRLSQTVEGSDEWYAAMGLLSALVDQIEVASAQTTLGLGVKARALKYIIDDEMLCGCETTDVRLAQQIILGLLRVKQ